MCGQEEQCLSFGFCVLRRLGIRIRASVSWGLVAPWPFLPPFLRVEHGCLDVWWPTASRWGEPFSNLSFTRVTWEACEKQTGGFTLRFPDLGVGAEKVHF